MATHPSVLAWRIPGILQYVVVVVVCLYLCIYVYRYLYLYIDIYLPLYIMDLPSQPSIPCNKFLIL